MCTPPVQLGTSIAGLGPPGLGKLPAACHGAAPRHGFPRFRAACAAHLAGDWRVGGLWPCGAGCWGLRCSAVSAGQVERRAGPRRAHGLARGNAVRGRRRAAAAAIWVGARARPAGGAALACARRGSVRRRRSSGVPGGAWRGVGLQAARPGAGAEAARACSPHARHPVSGPVQHVQGMITTGRLRTQSPRFEICQRECASLAQPHGARRACAAGCSREDSARHQQRLHSHKSCPSAPALEAAQSGSS